MKAVLPGICFVEIAVVTADLARSLVELVVLPMHSLFFRKCVVVNCVHSGFARNGGFYRHAKGGLEAYRAISTGKLHALLHFHTRPIDVVVYYGSQARPGFEVGFPLRCLQRLSLPHLATLQCHWRDNRYTRGVSTPVLSY